MQQRIIRVLDEPDGELQLAQLRTVAVLRLPFHLGTGPIFRFVDPDQDRIHIWLRNRVSIPHNAGTEEIVNTRGVFTDDYFTDGLIVDRIPEFRPGEFEAVKCRNTSQIGPASLKNPGFRLLNEVIAAHQMVRIGPYVAALGTSWPGIVPERELFQRLLVEFVLIANEDRVIDQDIIIRLLDELTKLPIGRLGTSVGELKDFSNEQLSALGKAVQRLRNHAFYELKTKAISASLCDERLVALVLGCAALEGAHGAFIRLALRGTVPEGAEFNKFISSLLREQGFSSIVQISARVLMTAEERPTEDQLKRCLEGVTIRNAIMHSLIDGKGRYKFRELSPAKVNEGYKGIMELYRVFEAAVEAREDAVVGSIP